MTRTTLFAAILAALIVTPLTAQAKRHVYRGGACDGIHRCRCGSTQAAYFGLPRIYNGHNLWEAKEWGHFPRTSLHAGAVGVKPHHVFRIVQLLGNGRAIVADDRGQHEYNIAGAIFVDVNGNGVAHRSTHVRVASARGHHHRYQIAQVSSAISTEYMDRMTANR